MNGLVERTSVWDERFLLRELSRLVLAEAVKSFFAW